MKKNTFYVTTPIYYTNAPPHLGGAYTTIAADILARWNKLLGKEVFFLTGTDEHGQKIQEAAERNGKTPKQFVDEIAKSYKEVFKLLDISNDNFIRTTEAYHQKEVKKILQELYDKKFIYKGVYESLYCVGCEQYKTESELVDGKCPLHKTTPELRKEEAYLFKLSKFQDKLLKLIKSGEFNIQPESRRKEIISFIESGLRDISVSRLKKKVYWGIELPFDKEHSTFVWLDAFWNYVSGLKTPGNKKKFWPADVQLMAKDILRVHATIWPALLLALGYDLPKTLFVHGYFTVNGEKMSKSLGNVIDPKYLVENYGADSVRYYLMRNIPFGQDGDVSEKNLIEKHNHELADKLGNLVSRVSVLAEKYGLEQSKKLSLSSRGTVKTVQELFEKIEPDKALHEIFLLIDKCNEYVQAEKPWETHDKKALWQLANAIKDIAVLISPFMPETAEKIAQTFKFDISLDALEKPLKVSKIKKADILFKKIDMKEEKQPQKQAEKPQQKEKHAVQATGTVSYDEFAKLDLRVGKIVDVQDHPNADKLYVLTVDLGEGKNRTIVAGLRQRYSKDHLKGKKAVFVANLAPAMLRGVESQGMILAAGSADDSQVFFLQPEKDIAVGSKVR